MIPNLQPNSPATYRTARGRAGASDLMSPDVGKGGRYFITTGDASTVNGGTAALTQDWRRFLDLRGPSFALFVVGGVLLLVHAHAGASFSASASVRK